VSRPTLVFAIQATQCWTCREVRRVRRADTPRSCKTNEPLAKPYYAKAYSHEEIGSFCLRDPLFGGTERKCEREIRGDALMLDAV
jgi:hypothetical protein